MIPELYLLRPSDWSSVPAVFGVLGITSPLPAVPLAGGSVHRLARSSVPMPPGAPPRGGTVFVQDSRSTSIDKRRPSQNPHQTLYTPPGGAIFPEAGITSGDE